MEPALTAIELTGTVNERHELQLDGVLPIQGPTRVRVIVLYSPADEWDEGDMTIPFRPVARSAS